MNGRTSMEKGLGMRIRRMRNSRRKNTESTCALSDRCFLAESDLARKRSIALERLKSGKKISYN